MKANFKKINAAIIAIGLGSIMGVSSCKKNLDINNNPNIATVVTPQLLLPSAEVRLAVALGVDIHVNGNFWSQYWTQGPSASQYKDIEQYQPSGSDYDREWGQFYSGTLTDLKKVAEIANTAKMPQYVAISKLLTAYTYQVITDAWGDVPFTQALRGDAADGGILSPKYDPQALIYDSLIAMVDQGLAIINPTDAKRPTTDDVIFGGNMNNWRRFGNTLKLKLFMRLSEVNPTKAQAGVSALLGSGVLFLDSTVNAQVNFFSTAGNRNPLATEVGALQFTPNIVASSTAIDSLLQNNDPRIAVFYEPAFDAICNDRGFLGLQQGNYNASASTLVSKAGPRTGGNTDVSCTVSAVAARTAPVRLLMGYESLLLQAEAAARGWSGANADSLMRAGIRANFGHLGIGGASAGYIASSPWAAPLTGSVNQKVRQIITQKWFCMTGIQGFEAWTEWRRTGFPDFFKFSVTSLIGNRFPVRFPYPNTELSRNTNFPGQPAITDRVYWDIN